MITEEEVRELRKTVDTAIAARPGEHEDDYDIGYKAALDKVLGE